MEKLRVSIEIKRFRRKPILLFWIADLKTEHLKPLFDAEQMLNALPFCPYRFHVNVSELEEGDVDDSK